MGCHQKRTVFLLCEWWLLRVSFSALLRCSMVAAAAATPTPTMLMVPRRRSFYVTIKPRRCTIRVRLFVSRTEIMMTNTAGTLPIIFRSGIGKDSLVQAVMAVLSVVQSVPQFIRPARLLAWLPMAKRAWYRDRYFDFVLCTYYKHNTDFSDYIEATEDDDNNENKKRICFKYNLFSFIW